MPTPTITTEVTDVSALSELRQDWQKSLTGPQDGMWESFRNSADHWAFIAENRVIGYACANEEYGLLQFYLLPKLRHERVTVLRDFLKREQMARGMVGTNNPVYLSAALELTLSLAVDTYLFTDEVEVLGEEKAGDLVPAEAQDLERLVGFYHESIGAPRSWLKVYLDKHVARGEVFILAQNGTIIGACEVRNSDSNQEVADIGMMVAPAYRRQGFGTFLLGKAKALARERGRAPICSCEKSNVGSARSIQKNGFRSTHQLLRVTF